MTARSLRCWLLMALLHAAGCGYTQKELFPPEYRTVATPIFENRSFYRGVEFDLTEALAKEVELRTPYKVVSQAGADTLLRGTITRIDQRQLSSRRDVALPEEVELVITVDFQWKDQRSGQVLRDRRGFQSVGRYVPTRPLGEPMGVGQHEAVQRLARDIVSTLRTDW